MTKFILSALALIIPSVSLAGLNVSDASVRLLPAGVPNTSVYLTLTNTSADAVTLVGAETDIAHHVEIHNHVMHGEMMKMEKQDKLVIKGGETVTFSPGGLHLMVFGLTAPLKEGGQITMTLIDENGNKTPFMSEVTRPGAEKQKESSHNHHKHHH